MGGMRIHCLPCLMLDRVNILQRDLFGVAVGQRCLYAGMTYNIYIYYIYTMEKKREGVSCIYTYIYIEVALRAEDVCITWLRLVAYRANAPGASVQVVGVYANAQILLFDQSARCQEENNILLERLLGVC